MKVRESGMPDRSTWEGFFSPADILEKLGMDGQVKDVAEFGSGYGTFTIPAAKLIKGVVYALDIEPDMINITNAEAMKQALGNVRAMVRDLLADGSGLPNQSVDYAMLFNILHLENPELLVKEAYRVVKDSGKLGIIHWNYDSSTPRGPSMDIRVKPEQCIDWATKGGFVEPKQFDLKPYHYGILMTKKGASK
jgi:SAM-dependent methyltransferase